MFDEEEREVNRAEDEDGNKNSFLKRAPSNDPKMHGNPQSLGCSDSHPAIGSKNSFPVVVFCSVSCVPLPLVCMPQSLLVSLSIIRPSLSSFILPTPKTKVLAPQTADASLNRALLSY